MLINVHVIWILITFTRSFFSSREKRYILGKREIRLTILINFSAVVCQDAKLLSEEKMNKSWPKKEERLAAAQELYLEVLIVSEPINLSL